jgi:hypothetical protein
MIEGVAVDDGYASAMRLVIFQKTRRRTAEIAGT